MLAYAFPSDPSGVSNNQQDGSVFGEIFESFAYSVSDEHGVVQRSASPTSRQKIPITIFGVGMFIHLCRVYEAVLALQWGISKPPGLNLASNRLIDDKVSSCFP